MNITTEIIASAEARKLDMIATGGGCDYICRYLNKGENEPIMVLGAQDDPSSPDKLDQPSVVTIYFEDTWTERWICFNFDTAVEAMDFMAAPAAFFDSEKPEMTNARARAIVERALAGYAEDCVGEKTPENARLRAEVNRAWNWLKQAREARR